MVRWKRVRPENVVIPPFPLEYDRTIRRDSRDGQRIYGVNLYRRTCTCEDFLAHRLSQKVSSLDRFCRHLVDEICMSPALGLLDPLLKGLFQEARGRYEGLASEGVYFMPYSGGRLLARSAGTQVHLFIHPTHHAAAESFLLDKTLRWIGSVPEGSGPEIRRLLRSAMRQAPRLRRRAA